MDAINKAMVSMLLGFVALGLTGSLSAYAEVPFEVTYYCTSCHDGLTVTGTAGTVVIGGGVRPAPQRSTADWVSTIDRMNTKGCGVPAYSVTSIANYLASLVPDSTTCYKADGTTVTASGTHYCPSSTSFVPPPTTCSSSMYMLSENQRWTCINTPPSPPALCTGHSGSVTYYYYAAGNGWCN